MKTNNKEFDTYIYKIVDNILIKDDIENTKKLFLIILDSLERFPYLYKLFDDNFIEKLMDIVPMLERTEERARAISVVFTVMYTFEYNCTEDTLNNFFELYLDSISNGCYDFTNIKDTIFLLNSLGMSYDSIFEGFLSRCSEEYCIHLFTGLHHNFKNKIIIKYPDVIAQMEKIERLQIRFFKILHFYFMADFEWAENLDIIKNYLKPFTNYWGICADWLFFSDGHRYNYVSNNILSEKEEQIFMAIGDSYRNCQDEFEPITDTTDELFDFLADASDRFRQSLKSEKVRKLLVEFKNGQNFIDVAMNLPDSD